MNMGTARTQRPDNDAAWGQTLARMDSLEQVRPFMCPKSRGDATACLKCPGFSGCPAGQRAVVLLDRETAPEYRQVWTEEAAQAKKAVSVDAEREEFRSACESGNAWNYLMETRGLGKDAAKDLLTRMIKKFPGIAADYGGGRRIVQRPKVVKITSMAETPQDTHTEPQDAREQAPGAEEEQTHVPEEKAVETAENGRKTSAAIQARVRNRMDAARERCRTAVESGDPRAWLMAQGRTLHNVTNTISRWRADYPDLMQDVPVIGKGATGPNNSRAEKARKLYEECLQAEDPVAYYMEKRGVDRKAAMQTLRNMRRKYGTPEEPETDAVAEKPEEDQITLEDFLSEYAEAPEERPRDAPQRDPDPAGDNGKGIAGDDLKGKFDALEHEKQGLRAEIEKAEERIRCIEELQEALGKVLSLFR